MRSLIVFAAVAMQLSAQWTLYSCIATTKNWVVGYRLLPSGVFRRTPDGAWSRAGFNHPITTAVDYDRRDPSIVYLAAGNGLIRMSDRGAKWQFLTGHDVTELRDVSVDPNTPGTLYFAHCAGIRATHDDGKTWQEIAGSLPRRYTEAIRVDRTKARTLLAGTEDGIWRSEDDGQSWKRAGATGFQILRIAQSPHDKCTWLAGTERGGLFASTDCGVTFENSGTVGVGRNLYDVAFDPSSPQRIAVSAWGLGVAVSEDGGKSWEQRNEGLPRPEVRSVIFDPSRAGRMFASVWEEALYVSEDAGKSWKKDGLEGSVVYGMRFVPEGGAK